MSAMGNSFDLSKVNLDADTLNCIDQKINAPAVRRLAEALTNNAKGTIKTNGKGLKITLRI